MVRPRANTSTVVKSLVNFARSPTWIAPQFVGRLAPAGRATAYTEEQKERFRTDPEYLKQYRREVDHELNGRFPNFYKGSPAQQASRDVIEKSMREKLAKMDPELREKLIPDFDVGCRRLVPLVSRLQLLFANNHAPVSPPAKVTSRLSRRRMSRSCGLASRRSHPPVS